MKYEDDHYTLSTGRTFYANNGILGLSPERTEFSQRLTISEGYDGGIELDHGYSEDEKFTAAERSEIAAYMIDLWQQWAVQPPPERGSND